ncbi:hypothetical protein FEK35_06570 [Nocardia cyriacigeorgica]|uniref:Transposase n=1 Tax=Nocardia cyriacigeorgica TaxID=135487 RepID=A0A5R8PIF2_9NOCA|nr:hypothetical protein [Nocardia cyriacigeorgica]TLG14824.1 hypothetical protein FEK35_06570 [Nocardia cyriacigeorgica]
MAKRFTDAEKARAVKKVEKLRAEGKSLNAACEEVVQKAGWPSVGALTNWVKAAAASANGAAVEEPAAEAEAAPAPRKRVVKKAPKARAATARKRAASTNGSSAPKKAAAKKAAPKAVPVTAATLVAEPEPAPVVEELTSVTEAPAPESVPAPEQAPEPQQRAAELVAVSAPAATSTVTPVADPEFGHRSADDLANEVRRLRIALEELHGENRALKDLVGIYVRR